MVINPDPNWTHEYLATIDAIERDYTVNKNQEHVCGFPTRSGMPCKNPPAENLGKITNGRCGIHGGYPPIRNAKQAIFTRKVDFMVCEKCDIFANTEGLKYKCEHYAPNQTCPIEAELYERLWDNLNTMYEFNTFPQQVMLDSAIREFVRQDRAWRVENVIGIGIATKTGISAYYERATENIIKYFDRLGIVGNKATKKTFGALMDDLKNRKL